VLYVEATRGQDLRSWLSAHEHAYSYYGGVSEVTVPDNLKSGVTKACFYDPELNPSYAELATHYSTAVLSTRVAKPRDNGVSESWNSTLEFELLSRQRFATKADARRAVARCIDTYNTTRRHSGCEMHSPIAYEALLAQRARQADSGADAV
jgi:transposase